MIDVLDKELIFLNQDFSDNEMFFKFIEKEASALDYLNTGYAEALTEREHNYPTGLQLDGKGIAIPTRILSI